MTYNEHAKSAARRTLRPLGSFAVAALIGSGCLTVAAQAGADPDQGQAVKYSQCMRANGVNDFPDPNAQGQFLYGGVSVPKEVWQNAIDTCKDLQTWVSWGGRTPEQQDAALKFAQCMRDNGVPDFPDPVTPQDPLIDTSKMRGDVSASSIPELKPAQQACHTFFTAALPSLGTGQPG
jgi:hypothetical protein